MKIQIVAILTAIAAQSFPATALTVSSGDVIRGEYTFATLGAPTLEPSSFLLRLSSLVLFGAGDSVGIRYLDSALTPISFSRFDSTGTGLDPTVGILFEPTDVLPPMTTAAIPSTGFVDIVGLAGSFDVLSLNLSAVEAVSSSTILRRTNVSDFQRVDPPAPQIPLPATGTLLFFSVMAGLGLNRLFRRRTRHMSTSTSCLSLVID